MGDDEGELGGLLVVVGMLVGKRMRMMGGGLIGRDLVVLRMLGFLKISIYMNQ